MNTRLFVAGVAILSACCGSLSGPTGPTSNPGGSVAILAGAGDIADCTVAGSAQTASLLDGIDGAIFTAGDNAYPSATDADFRQCYDPTWGRHKSRTRPVPGNHEYETAGGAAYFNYFGARAGSPGLGYYSYSLGSWHIVALNSEIDVSAGSAQVQWLRSDLGSRARCTAAIWHRPLFSSGEHGDNRDLLDLWRVLYEFDVDLVISAHDHMYERFSPQDPDGRFDPARGIRQFTVGTGGAHLGQALRVHQNSEVRFSSWGVLRLTLLDGSYQWDFVPVEGSSLTDVGVGFCH